MWLGRRRIVADRKVKKLVTVLTPDLGNFDGAGNVHAGRGNFDTATHAQDSRFNLSLENQIRAGVCHGDPGNRALSAQIRGPGAGVRRIPDQAAFLNILSAVVILEIVGTL